VRTRLPPDASWTEGLREPIRWLTDMQPRMTTMNAPLVLIAEDDEDSRLMYAAFLGARGFRTLEATNGEEAISRARSALPNVVVLDLSLPLVDGIVVARTIKGDLATRDARVIALSGFADEEHRELALEAGADLYLVKPCPPRALLAHLRTSDALSSKRR
jgi:two-component system cell cycle response regulator DivK